ncbi:MAG: hypothetical protein GXO83_07445 [Chlorobi bacterium]|nr:hypothetical protein [Chlorobiota bacterium]
MGKIEPLLHGKYYHIFNRGINSGSVIYEENDFVVFLNLFSRYIPPIGETFAYCLMNNHFHFLVRIRETGEIELKRDNKPFNPSRQFSHLFNTYTRWFNIVHKRTVPLFENPFKRKSLDSELYFKQLIVYIHTNPIHHGIASKLTDYPWTSYIQITIGKVESTKVSLADAVSWFGNIEDFIAYHNKRQNAVPGILDV